MARRVTLEDIARESAVSLATVSLVLRNKPGINEETRRRVLLAAQRLGYRRSNGEGVPPLRLQRIGVLIKTRAGDPPQTNPFYAQVLAGIEAACRRLQINLLLATVPVDEDNHPEEVPRMLLEDELDGLLLVGAFVDATISRLLARPGRPVVLVDAYASDAGYDSVISDNFRGAYDAVSYLIARGHRHIGLIGSLPHTYPSLEERRRGYLQALQDHAITTPYFGDCHVYEHEAAQAALDLLQRSPQITALFCCNDLMALAALRALRQVGVRLPEDLSIVGFDDIESAAHVSPALTTMRVDKASMGRLAVQLLLNRADYPDASCVTTVLRPTLIERASVAQPAARVDPPSLPAPGRGR